MSSENKVILVKRGKSFLWRSGMMLVVAGIAFILDNLNLLALSPYAVTLVGLILGEISKQLNSHLSA